jgi:hypothetical protein
VTYRTKRSVATAVIAGLMVAQTLGMVSAADVQAQVSQPDYGAGPGVAAGAPVVTNAAGPLNAEPVQPTIPGVRSAVPPVRSSAPGVQQAGPVAATTLPRTGGLPSETQLPWGLVLLGTMLVGVLAIAGRPQSNGLSYRTSTQDQGRVAR